MNSNQEQYARQLSLALQKKLTDRFHSILKFLRWKKIPDFIVEVEGAGTLWNCLVTKGSKQCKVACLHIDRTDLKYKGPEYVTRFKTNGKKITEGRTFSKSKTMDAIKFWLQNKSIEELYEHFSFVEEEKRQLEKTRLEIIESNLRETEVPQGEIITDHFSVTSLWFINGNRSTRIYYFGYSPQPRYAFYQDDASIFETFGLESKRLGNLVARWTFDKASISVLKEEYPEVAFGLLSNDSEK